MLITRKGGCDKKSDRRKLGVYEPWMRQEAVPRKVPGGEKGVPPKEKSILPRVGPQMQDDGQERGVAVAAIREVAQGAVESPPAGATRLPAGAALTDNGCPAVASAATVVTPPQVEDGIPDAGATEPDDDPCPFGDGEPDDEDCPVGAGGVLETTAPQAEDDQSSASSKGSLSRYSESDTIEEDDPEAALPSGFELTHTRSVGGLGSPGSVWLTSPSGHGIAAHIASPTACQMAMGGVGALMIAQTHHPVLASTQRRGAIDGINTHGGAEYSFQGALANGATFYHNPNPARLFASQPPRNEESPGQAGQVARGAPGTVDVLVSGVGVNRLVDVSSVCRSSVDLSSVVRCQHTGQIGNGEPTGESTRCAELEAQVRCGEEEHKRLRTELDRKNLELQQQSDSRIVAAAAARVSRRGGSATVTKQKAVGWMRLKNIDLQEECRKRGLAVGGTKAVLVQRIEASDVDLRAGAAVVAGENAAGTKEHEEDVVLEVAASEGEPEETGGNEEEPHAEEPQGRQEEPQAEEAEGDEEEETQAEEPEGGAEEPQAGEEEQEEPRLWTEDISWNSHIGGKKEWDRCYEMMREIKLIMKHDIYEGIPVVKVRWNKKYETWIDVLMVWKDNEEDLAEYLTVNKVGGEDWWCGHEPAGDDEDEDRLEEEEPVAEENPVHEEGVVAAEKVTANKKRKEVGRGTVESDQTSAQRGVGVVGKVGASCLIGLSCQCGLLIVCDLSVLISQSCRHEDYCLGVGYKQEANPRCCVEGMGLFEAECSNDETCGKLFVAALTGTEQEKRQQFVPSARRPAWKCAAMEAEECGHILCHDCFHKASVEYARQTDGKRSRRKRG